MEDLLRTSILVIGVTVGLVITYFATKFYGLEHVKNVDALLVALRTVVICTTVAGFVACLASLFLASQVNGFVWQEGLMIFINISMTNLAVTLVPMLFSNIQKTL